MEAGKTLAWVRLSSFESIAIVVLERGLKKAIRVRALEVIRTMSLVMASLLAVVLDCAA
jgi:hypothetical protein